MNEETHLIAQNATLPPCSPITITTTNRLSGEPLPSAKGEREAGRQRNPWKKILTSLKNSRRSVRNAGVETKESIVRITPQDLEDQFVAQKGRCYWLGIKLDPMLAFETANWLTPSVDKLDSAGFYEKGNFVLTCRFANLGRAWCPAKEFGPQIKKIRQMLYGEMWPRFLFEEAEKAIDVPEQFCQNRIAQ